MQIPKSLSINSNIGFKAMKPNQFQGVDYAVVRKFKAPVEKFNTVSDLQNWAKESLQKLFSEDYKGRQFHTAIMRKLIINSWRQYFEETKERYSFTAQLMVISSLIKSLKSTDDILPPNFRVSTFCKSFEEIVNMLDENKEILFDFQKIYSAQLKTELINPQDTKDGWIILPSQKNDPEHFNDNVEKLKILSAKKWCTKSFYAEEYLKKGDFHIYMENGIPQIGIRFSGVEVQEIQGIENNISIPSKYLLVVKKHINSGEYFLNDDIEYIIKQSESSNI